jgi:hypothetical protein
MKRSANIASYPSREDCLLEMLESIKGQFDYTRVYWNGKDASFIPEWVEVMNRDGDLTDLGKFRFLVGNGFPRDKHEYYFTLDDDLIYPETYADDMVSSIKEHGCIVTHHGRRLLGKGLPYYKGHELTMCLNANPTDHKVDVGGTGVMAFNTHYYRPLIFRYSRQCMADLVLAEDASLKGKDIVCLAHPSDYFGYLNPKETIHDTEHRTDQQRLIRVADKIFQNNATRNTNPIQ